MSGVQDLRLTSMATVEEEGEICDSPNLKMGPEEVVKGVHRHRKLYKSFSFSREDFI